MSPSVLFYVHLPPQRLLILPLPPLPPPRRRSFLFFFCRIMSTLTEAVAETAVAETAVAATETAEIPVSSPLSHYPCLPPPLPPPPLPPPFPPLSHACDDNWTWDKKNKSLKVLVLSFDGWRDRLANFHMQWADGTAGVRGTRKLNGGRFYWEINVSPRIFGTSMMFGIGTEKACLHVDREFINLLGKDSHSWGLSHRGVLWHDGKHSPGYTEKFVSDKATKIGILFDGILGTLTYYKDNVPLPTAFHHLDKVQEPLYPIVCSTAARTEMALGVTRREFVSLQDRCRATVLQHITKEEQVDALEIPRCLKQFIIDDFKRCIDLHCTLNHSFPKYWSQKVYY